MKNLTTFFLAVLVAPQLVFAATYDKYDYVPEYRPSNFDDALEYSKCAGDLETFDEVYNLNYDAYRDSFSNPSGMFAGALESYQDGLLEKLSWNKFDSENEFRDCIEKGLSEAEEKRITQERENAISIALVKCDFDFFSSMTTEEKKSTYDERKSCEDKLKEESKPISVIPASVPIAPEPIIYTPTLSPASQPVVQQEEEITTEVEEQSSTTESETIEITEEELNRLVDERVKEVMKEAEPEPVKKPFLKRVWDFFFRWF